MSDRELLDYLMTSDLSENLNGDQLKDMILFFRKYVRKCNSSKSSLQYKIEELEKKLEYNELLSRKALTNEAMAQRKLEQTLNRKLSWKERLFGSLKNNNRK